MAAIDPDESPNYEDVSDTKVAPRATLKLIRQPILDMDESDEDDEEDEDEEGSDEEANGGPSDKQKARELKETAVRKDAEDSDEDDEDADGEGFDLKAAISKLVKGKAPATDGEDDDESDDVLELDEAVICTLDFEKVCPDS